MTGEQAPATVFAVVPAEVADAGKFVQQTATALVNGIRSADNEIQGLTATWKGRAADAYLAGWQEARDGAVDVLEALETLAELLGVTAVAASEVDVRNAAETAALGNSHSVPMLNI
ncbi:WXG100 family type VII secretion target [Nocardia asteroides]|uniref:WXG100 family type VII secretion target n=1 Tax=Nocardia asteroides TaxID=1824 RepID=UPI003434083A